MEKDRWREWQAPEMWVISADDNGEGSVGRSFVGFELGILGFFFRVVLKRQRGKSKPRARQFPGLGKTFLRIARGSQRWVGEVVSSPLGSEVVDRKERTEPSFEVGKQGESR